MLLFILAARTRCSTKNQLPMFIKRGSQELERGKGATVGVRAQVSGGIIGGQWILLGSTRPWHESDLGRARALELRSGSCLRTLDSQREFLLTYYDTDKSWLFSGSLLVRCGHETKFYPTEYDRKWNVPFLDRHPSCPFTFSFPFQQLETGSQWLDLDHEDENRSYDRAKH